MRIRESFASPADVVLFVLSCNFVLFVRAREGTFAARVVVVVALSLCCCVCESCGKDDSFLLWVRDRLLTYADKTEFICTGPFQSHHARG